jgi:transcription elongation factor Elf1
MDATIEHFFNCPYCAEEISMILEMLYGSQRYIEDCQVCCQPIEIEYQVTSELALSSFVSSADN